MILEPFHPADLDALPELRPEGWGPLGPAYEYYLRHDNCRPVKVLANRRVAGVACAIRFGNSGWLAEIVVAPDMRCRGIGRFMVTELTAWLLAQVPTVTLIATDLGFPVYAKAGFALQAEYQFCEREEALPALPLPEQIGPATPEDLPAILALDRLATGEERRAMLAEWTEKILVYRNDGAVRGWYLPELREKGVIAADPAAGLALLRLRAACEKSCTFPAENSAAAAFFQEQGFAEKRRVRRMVLGEPFPWRPEMVFSRFGGNSG